MRTPLIVDIKRHSLEDGPGIRSVVFFKGCPLHCRFCQNPETQESTLELSFDKARCIGCLACVSRCDHQAIRLVDGRPSLNRDQCRPCDLCSAVCPSGALTLIGRTYSIHTLAEILLRDEPYYRHSQGGVTFSGGECALYPEYVGGLAQQLKNHSIHLAVPTSGFFMTSNLRIPNDTAKSREKTTS
jgi:pyruvate formate lyase activating enzyme